MKKTILTILALCLVTLSWGQDPFCCLREGTELKYVTSTAKGKEMQTSVTKIDEVKGANGNYDVTQTITIYENGEVFMKPMTVTAEIRGGNASMALGGSMAIQVDSEVPVVPSDLSVGKKLDTGTMKVVVAGIPVEQIITSNEVVAQEDVVTPAGTFDCFAVEQKVTVKMGPIKVNQAQKIWYSRGYGVIKMEVYDKKGKVAQRQELVELSK